MRKIFTSLIAFAVLLCAVVFASAAVAGSSGSEPVKSMNILILVVDSGRAVGGVIHRIHHDEHLVAARVSEDFPLVSEKMPVISIESLLPDAFPVPGEKPKIDAPKTVEPQLTRTFYDLPPDVRAYNGIGFANLIRAQPEEV